MKIEKIANNKKQFLDLLLLADEQENMIDRYLEKGDLFALYDGRRNTTCGYGLFEKRFINERTIYHS